MRHGGFFFSSNGISIGILFLYAAASLDSFVQSLVVSIFLDFPAVPIFRMLFYPCVRLLSLARRGFAWAIDRQSDTDIGHT